MIRISERPQTSYVGTAGWSIPTTYAAEFPVGGSHLERYATTLSAAEINTSFYRLHRRATYERWAGSVPADFRFSVKIPRSISHEHALRDCGGLLNELFTCTSGLGAKHGAWLLQLPPKQAFEEDVFRKFAAQLRAHSDVPLVVEPRHPSWFVPDADACLVDCRVGRVAADPAPVIAGRQPGGWNGLCYFRWHGSPRTYYSDYDDATLALLWRQIADIGPDATQVWSIFDNTASGAALGNALSTLRRHESE